MALILANFGRCQSLNTRTTINFITFSYTSYFFLFLRTASTVGVALVYVLNISFLLHNLDLIARCGSILLDSNTLCSILNVYILCAMGVCDFHAIYSIYLFFSPIYSYCLQIAWLRVDTQTILTIQTHVITKNHRMVVTHAEKRAWQLKIKDVKETDKGWYMVN